VGQIPNFLREILTREPVGKTLAYTSIVFTNSKGEIAARGSHTK
jgi:acyl-coenzyme A thioesterase 13